MFLRYTQRILPGKHLVLPRPFSLYFVRISLFESVIMSSFFASVPISNTASLRCQQGGFDTISLSHFPVLDHCVWRGHISKSSVYFSTCKRTLAALVMAVLREVTNSLSLFICILIHITVNINRATLSSRLSCRLQFKVRKIHYGLFHLPDIVVNEFIALIACHKELSCDCQSVNVKIMLIIK